ncbi:MAG: phage integrase SAM-like domain-containing protein [Verrucomicrobiaceae bacterium]
MLSRAKVYQRKRPDGTLLSPYWHAWFLIWDAQQQRWKPKTQTTYATKPANALDIAKEFERVALAAGGGPSGGVRLSREQVTAAIDDILRISGHRPIVHSRTWAEHAEAWLDRQKTRIPKTLTLRTWQTYSGHLKNFNGWLADEAATMPLLALTGDHLQRWYHAGIDSGLSANTMNNTATTLSGVFQQAIDEGIATRNPVNLINRDDTGGNTRDAFSLEQMDIITEHLRKTEQHDWLTVVLLGFCTSQRLEDCAHAVRSGFQKQVINGRKHWIWTLKQRKTGKPMQIPLVDPLAAHITKLMKVKPSSLLLAPSLAKNTVGGWQDSLSWQFADILKACGIAGRHVEGNGRGRSFNSLTFHSTRHTCNTLLAEAGIPADIRLLITGHGDKRTNLGYTHLTDQTKAKALEKAFRRKQAA